jgi:hypothetical protein
MNIMRITALVLFVTLSFSLKAQCLTRKYIDIAEKVFDRKLTRDDFAGNLFLTIDTVAYDDVSIPSIYLEYK